VGEAEHHESGERYRERQLTVKLLFVSSLGSPDRPGHRKKWGSEMNILFVSKLSEFARSVFPIAKYIEVGRTLGHEVCLFGEQTNERPLFPYTLDAKHFDFAVFVVYEAWDFPDMPYLAQLLDSIPKARRVIIDCCGRYNDTVRVEHDFNHLEKMDRHQGWEWIEGFDAVSNTILQPTLQPRRAGVRSFLWHGFDPAAVLKPYASAAEAASAWANSNGRAKAYGLTYLGHNWQRWTQLRALLTGVEPLSADLGPIAFAGSDWDKRPEWATELGIQGVDVDPELLARARVEAKPPVPFQEMIQFMSDGKLSPIVHRPLFNELGFVTNRTFATFCADTIPLLMLPEDLTASIYGASAGPLRLGSDITGDVARILRNPTPYWQAVLDTRRYLAAHHTFQHRFLELQRILDAEA
jgi:hypothetical protein